LTSRTTSVSTLENTQTEPPAPTFTIAALGTMSPATKFNVDAVGMGSPQGKTVTKPGCVGPIAVTLRAHGNGVVRYSATSRNLDRGGRAGEKTADAHRLTVDGGELRSDPGLQESRRLDRVEGGTGRIQPGEIDDDVRCVCV
jgi:hypothetical protein